MKRKVSFLLGMGLLVALAVGLTGLPAGPTAQPDEPAADTKGPDHKADEQAIRKLSAAFARALAKGDAKALAGFWTAEGEYIGDDGTIFRGRAAIEKAYADFFEQNPKLRVEGSIESVRFVSRDSAVEEGYLRVYKGKEIQPASSRYSALFVRENGRWLLALLRDWPNEGTDLRDLDWLIGTWVAKTNGREVRTTYSWDESKKFIQARFTIKGATGTTSGTQRIGRDPRTGQLRSWLFEDDGGYGEATWSWDGKRWLLEATGVQADGSEVTATNILTPRGRDAFTWQSVNRMEDGEELPNIAPIKVTRVK
jgi:uncharacterized protein (TIGR02246 family)